MHKSLTWFTFFTMSEISFLSVRHMPKLNTLKFEAQMLRESYYLFFQSFWPIVAAEKLVPSWYIQELCNELQTISERVFLNTPKEYDLVWNCPPGTSKSSIVSILWQPWIWTRFPSARFISGSYSERLALDLSRKSRDVIQSDKYKAMFPEVILRDDQNTKGYFANTSGGIRYAVGVGGSVIGMHAHFIAVDDPIDPQGALSDLVLAEANTWMGETLSRRKVNVMLTPTVLIMQRLHQDDPSGVMLSRPARIKHCCLPCDLSWDVKPESYRQNYVNGLLDPIRLPQRGLDEAFEVLGEVGYAGQYGENPVPRGGAKFKVDRLQFRLPNEVPVKWKRGPVRYWDKAATSKGGAYTAGVKLAMDDKNNVWILDVIRGQWDSGTREEIITKTAELDTKQCRVGVEQEPGASGKESAESTVKRLTLKGIRASMDKVTGDKELRADLLSQHVNTGSAVIVNAHWNKAFVEEMRFFPVSKYKDQIDAASGGFTLLVKTRIRIGAL